MDRKSPVDSHIGQRLKEYRQHRGMTVRELADAAYADFNNTTDEFGAGFTTGCPGKGSLQEKKRKPVVAEMKARQAARYGNRTSRGSEHHDYRQQAG